jgi:hypothetical protein
MALAYRVVRPHSYPHFFILYLYTL